MSLNIRFFVDKEFWSRIKPPELPRVYTSELRPDPHIEIILFRFAEISQVDSIQSKSISLFVCFDKALCCIYMLTFIPRSTHLGYLYRNPNIFNRKFCSLLICALAFQILSQTPLPPEVYKTKSTFKFCLFQKINLRRLALVVY